MTVRQAQETSWLKALGCLNELLPEGQSVAISDPNSSGIRYAVLLDNDGRELGSWRGADALGAIAVAATMVLNNQQIQQFLRAMGSE